MIWNCCNSGSRSGGRESHSSSTSECAAPGARSKPKREKAQSHLLEHPSASSMRGQSTMILILIVILLFAGTTVLLLTFAKEATQKDYHNLYVHNLLLSVLRSDTGYTDPNCKLVSDAIACAFFSPGYACGDDGADCLAVARNAVDAHLATFREIKRSYDYYMKVEPHGFTIMGPEGGPMRMEAGNASIASSRSRYAANEKIRKDTSSGVYSLDATLYMVIKA